jgi:hypothetical protein
MKLFNKVDMNLYSKTALFLLTLFFYTIEAGIIAQIFLIVTIFFLLEPLWDWIKKGKEEAKKIDAYYPEDKLKEYVGITSKKTTEMVDSKLKIDHKSIPHKAPVVSKNVLTELEKIFK